MEESILSQESLSDEDTEICPFCGNIYRIIHLKHGDDYTDSGTRHCPFCGLVIDEYARLMRDRAERQ